MFSAITGSLPNQPTSAFTTASPKKGGGDNLISRVEGARREAMKNQTSWSIDSMEGFFYIDGNIAPLTEADEPTSTQREEREIGRRNSSAELEDEEFQCSTGACSPLLEEEETAEAKSKRIMDFVNDNDLPSIIYLLEYADDEVKKLLKENTEFKRAILANPVLRPYIYG